MTNGMRMTDVMRTTNVECRMTNEGILSIFIKLKSNISILTIRIPHSEIRFIRFPTSGIYLLPS